jgi:hypothetical protein
MRIWNGAPFSTRIVSTDPCALPFQLFSVYLWSTVRKGPSGCAVVRSDVGIGSFPVRRCGVTNAMTWGPGRKGRPGRGRTRRMQETNARGAFT